MSVHSSLTCSFLKLLTEKWSHFVSSMFLGEPQVMVVEKQDNNLSATFFIFDLVLGASAYTLPMATYLDKWPLPFCLKDNINSCMYLIPLSLRFHRIYSFSLSCFVSFLARGVLGRCCLEPRPPSVIFIYPHNYQPSRCLQDKASDRLLLSKKGIPVSLVVLYLPVISFWGLR